MQSVDGRIDCDMVDTCGFEEFKPNNYIPVGKECFYKAHDSKELNH